jgi:hypothetical protein
MRDDFVAYLRPLDTYYWRPPPPRRTSWGYLAVAVSVVLVAVLVATALTATEPSGPVPPNQAGYQWCCQANEVAASWVVPKILQGATGSEGVWVGLQTDTGSFFLQVGTNEYLVGSEPVYAAFWSDGPLHGSPQTLGMLHPGDVVRAGLVKAPSGWSVSFSDSTRRWTHSLVVRHLAPSGGDLAEWVEEDPVLVFPSKREQLDSMAHTAQATMTNLDVNSAPPALSLVESESFTDNAGTTFSPTSLVDNAFSFIPW